jgi:hypothetical protein
MVPSLPAATGVGRRWLVGLAHGVTGRSDDLRATPLSIAACSVLVHGRRSRRVSSPLQHSSVQTRGAGILVAWAQAVDLDGRDPIVLAVQASSVGRSTT